MILRLNTILIFLLGSLTFTSLGQEVKVLFIGNSFTLNHEMPKTFEKIAKAHDKTVFVQQSTKGGADWEYHAKNPTTYKNIRSEKWDFVVLQAKSYEPILDSISVKQKTMRYGQQLIDSIRKNSPNTKILLYLTWGYKEGMYLEKYKRHADYIEMQEELTRAYLKLAEQYKVSIAPIGEIWKNIHLGPKKIELYDVDNFHPNHMGSFLIAASFYQYIFGEAISNLSMLSSKIDFRDAEYLAATSYNYIRSSNNNWGANYLIPTNMETQPITYSFKKDSILIATHEEGKKIRWIVDGERIKDEQEIIIPKNSSNRYEVELIIIDGLFRRTRYEKTIKK